MNKCDCHSYNGDFGETKEAIIDQSEYWDNGRDICVDACIEHVIRNLWKNKMGTQGSCCGHAGRFGEPRIIISPGEDGKKARELIAEVDNREFIISQWRLVDL